MLTVPGSCRSFSTYLECYLFCQNGILSRLGSLSRKQKPDNIHRTPTRNEMKKGSQLALAVSDCCTQDTPPLFLLAFPPNCHHSTTRVGSPVAVCVVTKCHT